MTPDRGELNKIVGEYYHRKDFTGWFDALYGYANGDAATIPWAKLEPNPLLMTWLGEKEIYGESKKAVVVGCGLGDDAEALAGLGFAVTAFDVSENAIAWCKQRFPHTQVDYRVMDLFALPDEWKPGFDFVFEALTIQSLPLELRERACASVADLVAPGGKLLLICFAREQYEPAPHVPFPLSREELQAMIKNGLSEQTFEEFVDAESGSRKFRVLYTRIARDR